MNTYTVIIGLPKPGGKNPDSHRRMVVHQEARCAIEAGMLAKSGVIGGLVELGFGDIDMDEYPILAVIEGFHIDEHQRELGAEEKRQAQRSAA